MANPQDSADHSTFDIAMLRRASVGALFQDEAWVLHSMNAEDAELVFEVCMDVGKLQLTVEHHSALEVPMATISDVQGSVREAIRVASLRSLFQRVEALSANSVERLDYGSGLVGVLPLNEVAALTYPWVFGALGNWQIEMWHWTEHGLLQVTGQCVEVAWVPI